MNEVKVVNKLKVSIEYAPYPTAQLYCLPGPRVKNTRRSLYHRMAEALSLAMLREAITTTDQCGLTFLGVLGHRSV